jgi:NADPH:quinone reductase-like Zn-dependent oxidoreductase
MGIPMRRANYRKDVADLADMLESGAVAPYIDRTHSLAEVPDALRFLESGESKGKLAISI